ncbi:methyltransferase domain-containing protein [Geomonas propionica]|uniref:Methyltransferase domain-containing protein n=1 Tax=Geomonas propionica TaxID=2798582 RepID=A0ABS0YPT7_9BACT|nr:methyltransferase domain-containing protein [Geomonas propionica]MBJ6799898.1 methyltransferase domain-containing protein [Geomonas propionica]
MKAFLLPHLICPSCLPKEHRLELSVRRQTGDDIIDGSLRCMGCARRFAIEDGVAMLLPGAENDGYWRYEDSETLNRYLWSHYADLHGDAGNAAAVAAWAGALAHADTPSLDAGCSVGRIVLELSATGATAVGCDLSLSFVKAARRLARERRLKYSLPLEGNLRETFEIVLPDHLPSEGAEFVVADALRLPFAKGSFGRVSSLNVLDRVGYPLAHLYEMNRVSRAADARLLLASPFSWTSSDIPEERWLGGTATGPYAGRGIDNVRALLEGKGKILAPPWRIADARAVQWHMRSHRNHCETFTSQTLLALR